MQHNTAVIGLGDMGMPIALNLLKAGHAVIGSDLRQERCARLTEAGGTATTNLAELAAGADTVFLMVMHGAQVHQIVLGPDGLLKHLKPGACIVVTATIRPAEFDTLIEPCAKANIGLIDSPVSGGRPGAEAGTLTLMLSGEPEVVASRQDALEAISGKIIQVAERPGVGMRVKAALQSCFGSCFAAIFECQALAAKAGVNGNAMLEVITSSGLASPSLNYCATKVVNREFTDTGSTMATIYKDIGISLDFAREQGVPMFVAAAAFQLFQSAMTAYPGEDNWAGVKVIEQISGTEVQGEKSP